MTGRRNAGGRFWLHRAPAWFQLRFLLAGFGTWLFDRRADTARRVEWYSVQTRQAFLVAGSVGLLCLITGCAKKDSSAASSGGGAESVESPGAHSGEHKSAASRAGGEKKAPKSPEVGGIPLDVWPQVWLKDPLAIAAEKGPAQVAVVDTAKTAPPSGKAATPTPPPAAPEPEKPAAKAAGSDDWKSLISGEAIAEETKKIRSRLADSLQTVTKYNGNYKDNNNIRMDGAVLAALAEIMTAHPDDVSWKKWAKDVRTAASEVSKLAKGLGQPSYEPTRKMFENLDGLLSGNKPAGLEESAPTVPFSEVANRLYLMKRMEKAFDGIKSNINGEDAFKKQAAMILQEESVLAVLTRVIGSPGYGSTDEAEYQGFVSAMIQSNRDVIEAVKNEDFKAFNDAMSRGKKACDDCHRDYRFGDSK